MLKAKHTELACKKMAWCIVLTMSSKQVLQNPWGLGGITTIHIGMLSLLVWLVFPKVATPESMFLSIDVGPHSLSSTPVSLSISRKMLLTVHKNVPIIIPMLPHCVGPSMPARTHCTSTMEIWRLPVRKQSPEKQSPTSCFWIWQQQAGSRRRTGRRQGDKKAVEKRIPKPNVRFTGPNWVQTTSPM